MHGHLVAALETGQTFRDWQAAVLAEPGLPGLGAAHLETVFRNNIQQSYNRGRYEQRAATVATQPDFMYDAVNDSRTRPSHAAMDGHVARHDDPIWQTWSPACGHRCRCRRIALSPRQAAERAAQDAGRLADPKRAVALKDGPDQGWGYDPNLDPNAGLRQAVARRAEGCQSGAQLAALLATGGDALWCRQPPLRAALEDMQRTLGQWQDEARLLRGALSPATYERLADGARAASRAAGLSEPQGVVLRAYTDRDLDAWPLMNHLARALPHTAPLGLTEQEMYRAGIMVQVMDAALARLPARAGRFERGVDPAKLVARREAFIRAHGRRGRRVVWEGYTSVMDGPPHPYRLQCRIDSVSARDLGAFSALGEAELLLPRSVRLEVSDALPVDDVVMIDLVEVQDDRPIPGRYRFGVGAA